MRDTQTLRADLPALGSFAYFNTGTAGPMPAPVAEAMRIAIAEDEQRGRISGKRFHKIDQLFAAARERFAALCAGSADQVALTSGTVDGIDIALEALGLRSGDTVLTTSIEHPAALAALERQARIGGFSISSVVIEPDDDGEAMLAAIAAGLTDDVRAILVSHVAYGTGQLLPLAAIASLARERGVTSIIDGAQAAGAVALALDEVDFYALPGQKWLLGPEGAGALIVAPHRLAALPIGKLATAAELERGTKAKPIWAGMEAALAWRAGVGTESEIEASVVLRRRRLAAGLAALPGITVVTLDTAAGLLSFSVAGRSATDISAALGAARIAVRDVPGTEWTRISCGFFNTDAEIDALVAALAAIVGTEPDQGTGR